MTAHSIDCYTTATGNKYTSTSGAIHRDNLETSELASKESQSTIGDTSEPISYLSYMDNILLQLSTPHYNYCVSSIIWVEGDLQPSIMLDALAKLCEQTPKFQQRCIPGTYWRRSRWEYMNTPSSQDKQAIGNDKGSHRKWSIDQHLSTIYLHDNDMSNRSNKRRDEADERVLIEERLSSFITKPFDMNLPLWRVLLVRGVSDNRSVIGIAAHHCMADGQGFARAMLSIMSPFDGCNDSLDTANTSNDFGKSTNATSSLYNNVDENNTMLNDSNSFGKTLIVWLTSSYTYLLSLLVIIGHFLVSLWYTLAIIASHLFLRRYSFNYRTKEEQPKRAAWSKPISMRDIQLIRAANPGVTLNDIIVACVERSFTAYLDFIDRTTNDHSALRRHKRDPCLDLFIPIGFRAPNDVRFENLASIHYLLLPFLPSNAPAMQSIRNAQRHMYRVKRSKVAHGIKFFATLFTKLRVSYPPLEFLRYAFNKRHGILTNVPGPTIPLCIEREKHRHKIISYALYPPNVANGCVSMGIASYNGHVVISAIADHTPIYPEKARRLVDGFNKAFEDMLAEAEHTVISSHCNK
ncbi:hypothetical protein BDF22DRAFT_741973 [Syncephalis plumigaleata]|nr:hypothetical protein BDF22DRAFT_741973 [Syncephalis plumigaleata]